jgi:hypothetical protein
MSQQIQITGGAKVRNLQDVIIGTSGVLTSLGFDVANGVPRLDVNGKILVSQLPNSVMEYKGVWNAATNTPTLANGTGNQGDVYLCNVAGTVDFGAGPIVFFVGDQVIYSGTIWQRASGATGSVTSVAITESGDSLNITGSPITTSGTINIGFNGTNLQYVNGAGNLTTFPILTGYVPYTGATANVDLGTFNLTADVITGATGSFASNGGSDTFAINHSSGSGIALNITKGGNGEGLYINKTSGSGNAATIIGTLNATTLVKSGGTSSQFLKADGTVDSSTYALDSAVVHLAGTETISGSKTFSGTSLFTGSATFNSALQATIGIIFPTSGTVSNGAGVVGLGAYAGGLRTAFNGGYTSDLAFQMGANYVYTFPAASGTIALTSDLAAYVPITRTITGLGSISVSGSGDLSANRTISIAQSSVSSDGYLSATDFNTFNNKQSALTNPVTGTGTTNYLPKFTGASTIGNSAIYDNGSFIGINTTTNVGYKVDIRSATGDADINIQPTIGTNAATLYLNNTGGGTYFGRENSAGGGLLGGSTPYATIMRSTGTNPIQFGVNNSVNFTIVNGGNVLIGTTTDAGYKLDVNGTGRFSGNIQVGGSAISGNSSSFYNTASETSVGIKQTSGATSLALALWNNSTTGDSRFLRFFTEATATYRGAIQYDRAGDRLGIYGGGSGLFFDGAATFSSSVTATSFFESSSIKGKDIIATNPLLALDIDVIKYTRKSDESKDIRYGYSAEQIHSLMPELTDKDVTAVKYLDVHTILISQLQKEIKELKAKIN